MSNARRIYLFQFFFMFLVIMPVIVPFFLSLGLSMRQVFELQALFGVTVLLAEVPTGYIGDIWGRKNSIVMGALINALGFSILPFATSYFHLLIFEITVGIGMSFVSGSDVSLLYDSVQGEREKSTKAIANLQLALVSGESVAALLGGVLVAWGFAGVTWANAVAAWIPFVVALGFQEPPTERMSRDSHRKNFQEVFRHIFYSQDALLRLIFINWVVWSLATFFAVWIHQNYWEALGVPLAYFGFLWAAYNLFVGIVGKQVHRAENRFGPVPLLVFLALTPVAGYLAMSFASGYWAVLLAFPFSASRGVTQVLLRDALNWRVPSRFRATANSLHSFFFRLGFAVFGPGVGYLIDRFGMDFTLRVLGLSFLVLFAFVLWPLVRSLRSRRPAPTPPPAPNP
ncbi:MAG: MFS transporter [Bdellovibrionales bacterium]